ncbi:unnamed protein product [Chrysoparadoxa australica]
MSASTNYGLAFLKHRADPAGGAQPAAGERSGMAPLPKWLGGGTGTGLSATFTQDFVPEKSDIEKQADVLMFLKSLPDRRPAGAAEIEAATGVVLDSKDKEVKEMLRGNPKVEIQNEDDPMAETFYVYYAKYNVKNRQGLLNLIAKCTSGVNRADLFDTYPEARSDIESIVRCGDVIAVKNKELSTLLLYPRGPVFLTKLRGEVSIEYGKSVAKCTEPLYTEIRRGEAVKLGEHWTRVSSEVESERQPQRAIPPESVAFDKDMSSMNVYAYEFEPGEKDLPLQTWYPYQESYKGPAIRHGCCKRIREMFKETLKQVPKEEDAMFKMMHQAGLTSKLQEGTKRRKKFHFKPGPGQRESQTDKKKRRQALVKSAKLTNDHLEGTALGALMEEARLHPEKFNI